MGTVISFPAERRAVSGRQSAEAPRSAAIYILPVIRIERHDHPPVCEVKRTPRAGAGRKRRRRSARS